MYFYILWYKPTYILTSEVAGGAAGGFWGVLPARTDALVAPGDLPVSRQ